MTTERERISARHTVRDYGEEFGVLCWACAQQWPCDASLLAAMLTPKRLAEALIEAENNGDFGPGYTPEVGAAAILTALDAQDAEAVQLQPAGSRLGSTTGHAGLKPARDASGELEPRDASPARLAAQGSDPATKSVTQGGIGHSSAEFSPAPAAQEPQP